MKALESTDGIALGATSSAAAHIVTSAGASLSELQHSKGEVRQIGTPAGARALAKHLQDVGRPHPVVVVSRRPDGSSSYIDVSVVAADSASMALVCELTTEEALWAFSDEMPPDTDVCAGAGRAYAPGLSWVHDTSLSPLRRARKVAPGEIDTRRLVDDALRMAHASGLSTRASAGTVPASGTVTGVVCDGARALVKLDGGATATVVAERTLTGLALHRVLKRGMRVTGLMDKDSKILDISFPCPPPFRGYVAGAVVLARVRSVSRVDAVIELAPNVAVLVSRSAVSENELDTPESLLTPGEVIRARICNLEPWALRLSDIDDDEPVVPAVSLIEGGPAWLVESEPATEALPAARPVAVQPRISSTANSTAESIADAMPVVDAPRVDAPRVDAPQEVPAAPPSRVPSPGDLRPASKPTPTGSNQQRRTPPPPPTAVTTSQAWVNKRVSEYAARIRELEQQVAELPKLHAMQRTIESLEHECAGLESKCASLEDRLEQTKAKYRKADGALQKVRRESAKSEEGPWFSDPEEQLRAEILLEWMRRIPASDKPSRSLRPFTFGPMFLESLAALEGIERSKIVSVLVEVAVGLDTELASRELHRLRINEGGGSPFLVREDGAAAWRVSLQIATPSARRLHYWRLMDGTIEFAVAGVHDTLCA